MNSVFHKIAWLVFAFLLFNFIAIAQPTFQKTLGGVGDEEVRDLVRTNDSNYVLTGYTTDSSGADKDVYVAKFDPNGDTLWTKTYGGSKDDVGNAITQLATNEFVIVGKTSSFQPLRFGGLSCYGGGSVDSSNIYFLKLDQTGNVLYRTQFGSCSEYQNNGAANSHPFDVIDYQLDSNEVVLTANHVELGGIGNKNILITKSKTYTSSVVHFQGGYGIGYNNPVEYSGSAIAYKNGNYTIVGSYGLATNNNGNVYLNSVDDSFNFQWTAMYNSMNNRNEQGMDMVIDNNNDYLITGYINNGLNASSGNDVLLLESTGNGNLGNISIAFGGNGQDDAGAIIQSHGNGYVVAGRTQSFGNGGWDVYLTKFNQQGTLQWSRTYGGSRDDEMVPEARSLVKTRDNGYLIAGNTKSFGAGGSDIYLIKTDSLGNSCTHQTNPTTDTSAVTFNKLIPPDTADSWFESGRDHKYSTVNPNSVINERDICLPSSIDFAYQDTCYGAQTQFYDSTLSDSLSGYSWSWHFDDPASGSNNTSSHQNPSHQFTSPGTYQVKLVVATGYVTDSVTKPVTIEQIFDPPITNSDTTICPGDSLQMQVQDTSLAAYQWLPGLRVTDSL